MSDTTLDNLLEEIASAIVFADPSQPETLEEPHKLVGQIAASFAAGLSDEARKGLTSFQGMLEKYRSKPSKNAAKDGQKLNDAWAALEAALRQAKAAPAPAAPAENFADEDLLKEFYSGQKGGLEEIEAWLLELEKGRAEVIPELRRRIHTLKGEAGVLGLKSISEIYHRSEDLLLAANLGPEVMAGVLFQVHEWLEGATSAWFERREPETSAEAVIELLKNAAEGQVSTPAPIAAPSAPAEAAPAAPAPARPALPEETPPAPVPAPVGKGAAAHRDPDTVALFGDFLHESDDGLAQVDQILIDAEKQAPTPDTANTLFRVFHSIKGVSSFLECKDVTSLAHATETLLNQVRQGQLELRGGILDLVFNATESMRQQLKHIREAIERDEVIQSSPELPAFVERLKAAAAGQVAMASEKIPQAEPGEKLGEILTREPISVPPPVVHKALEVQAQTGKKLGEELLAQGAVQPKELAHALRAQATATAKIQETIKVDVNRIDQLVEIIGELVVVESMVVNAPEIAALSSPRIRNYLNQLHKITRDAQDIGMRMRMVPVRGVFQKMARMVRDLSHKSGKQVRMELAGESTEMDRSMVEQIADPLVHMIRNSVDHGIESAEARAAAGKDPTGVVWLRAYHEGDHIVIEIADDGKGLDKDAILRKARAQGMVREDEQLSDAEIHQMIFLPGFSTAKQVTEISGRGVGMDVVRRNIDQMRGRIVIDTVPGKGTTFKLLLPLTLAIIDGMLIRCGEERYIIPTLSIVESVQPTPRMLVTFAQKGECINVRGEFIPLTRLQRLFGVKGALADPSQGLVVILEAMGRKIGLLVDQVISQQKVVIKSMGTGMQHVEFISGAAILSDGTVGLILNAEQLVFAEDRSRHRGSTVAA